MSSQTANFNFKIEEVDKMDFIYIILMMISLILLCLSKRKIAKTLIFITFVSYMTLVIMDCEPVISYIITLVKSGFSQYRASIDVFYNFLVIVSMALSLFAASRRNRKTGIVFVLSTIILLMLEHLDTIISIFK